MRKSKTISSLFCLILFCFLVIPHTAAANTQLEGITVEDSTPVFKQASTSSKQVRTYKKGVVINFREHDTNWFRASVFYNGAYQTGYIHKSSVEVAANGTESMEGMTANDPTVVYNDRGNEMQSLSGGRVIKFNEYTDSYYTLNVFVDGSYQEGYIPKTAVEEEILNSSKVDAVTLNDPTYVTNRNGTTLTSIPYDQLIEVMEFTDSWYKINIMVNGEYTTGYIPKSSLSTGVESPTKYNGVTVENPTNIYNGKMEVIKSYDRGSVVSFRDFSKNWYKLSVYADGRYQTGYTKKNFIEKELDEKGFYEGITINDNTLVSDGNGNTIKSYPYGSVVKFSDYTENWLRLNVYANGKYRDGYIQQSEVEMPLANSSSYEGVTTQNPTIVYNKNAKQIKTYDLGSIIKYRDFTENWYRLSVYADGKYRDGYLHKNAIETPIENPNSYEGIVTSDPTNVYGSNGEVISSFNFGRVLKYREFTDEWHKVSVYADGQYRTGYISTDSVEKPLQQSELHKGIINSEPTKVYNDKGQVIKNYSVGDIIRYRTFSYSWYKVSVYADGKYRTGYIVADKIEPIYDNPELLTVYAVNEPTNLYTKPSTTATITDNISKGTPLEVKAIAPNWYEYYDKQSGETLGYLYKDDISLEPLEIEESTAYDYTLDQLVEAQVKYGFPQTDLYRNDPAFVHSALVDTEKKTIIAEDGVRIRTEPYLSDDSTVYKTLNSGTVIEVVKEVQGASFRDSTLWYQINYDGRTDLYVHSTLVAQSAKSARLNTTSNIRAEATTSSHIYTRLSNGSAVSIQAEVSGETISGNNKWYQIWLGSWRNAKPSDVKYYLDPSNQNRFQFLMLSGTANSTISDLQPILEGKGTLSGHEEAFINASKDYNVNEVYLVAHALHETGNGGSTLAQGVYVDSNGYPVRNSAGELVSDEEAPADATKVYNMYGIAAYDSNPLNGGAKYAYEKGWTTPEKAIRGGANWISVNYVNHSAYAQNTLYEMKWNPNSSLTNPYRHQYATDIGWADKQIPKIKKIYDQLPNAKLSFDIPQYKQ
ncbi:Beta-N-acetylglucosaminidase [Thalassobacillus cyri]|uniref:Beta-N-acetylglucosaminidase n=1 Tax=Thalassobacillus cyri TaxID=571932 RepID=A0A1H4DWD6_9BACI|nr:SH3 domain-containing protein [Thalassobacillus cyri]SEA76906.1 Beta-N-acetylglucosaminidase [Thalassobacillus cyri]